MKAFWQPMAVRFISNRKDIVKGAGVFIFALLLVLFIGLAKPHAWVTHVDHSIMYAVGDMRGAGAGNFATRIMETVTTIGDGTVRLLILVAALAFLCWSRRIPAVVWMTLAVVLGALLNSSLKQIFAVPRPSIIPHLDQVNSFSFPSGHAAGNMILLGAIFVLIPHVGLRILIAALIMMIGLSRIWLGVHWPSDVLAGWIEGAGWIYLASKLLPSEQSRSFG